ncbi:RNA polymerase II transcription factor B subunit 1 [Sphaceloma murrayae]|uniref:RNA polymerase II transcription factor B subunit 1 n=1 Tax=Sphaceloma murrayae TaxID=2082308 RepID=A0A2K1QNV5_9PEZI|nr:RNA polymerase II transcription factor B subunit 1 [Sphaceloma murrayae]
MSRAATAYKKKEGTLAVGDDRKFLFWTPATPPSASPTLTIPVTDIVNLQQTPAANPKIALKVFVQPAGASAPETYIFSFTSPSAARKEQESITEVLRNAISALKSAAAPRPSIPTAGASKQDDGGSAQSAAMAIAKALSAGDQASETYYDDVRLKADIDLQQSLLATNQALRQRFNESLKDKPESITPIQFSAQFWSTRLHLLRAHAIEKAQKQGDYNVLPDFTYKRVPVEGQPDKLVINLAKEQIQLLFKQYPVVREAYNDNVPQIDANSFWSRFFNSRLIKKLRGEKITDADSTDPIFDRYLDHRAQGPASMAQVPHFIDLEGNEQNHSQRKGNRPDETMRPGEEERVPILRVLNNLSEKMLSSVTPADSALHGPIGMDEGTYEELQLRDLQASDKDNRVKLNIRDQQRFLAGEPDDQLSADAMRYSKLDPKKVLHDLQRDIQPSHLGEDALGSLRLDEAIGYRSDSDESDEEMDGQANGNVSKPKVMRMGASAALNAATTDVMASVRARRQATSGEGLGTGGLSQSTFDALTMTHNTTIEFLHYFWTLYLSGDPARTNELAKLVETLDKSVDRINAVAKTAEDERKKRKEAMSSAIEGLKSTSAKRRRIELEMDALAGGRKAVEQVIAPTMKALAEATRQYKKAFAEQSAAAA